MNAEATCDIQQGQIQALETVVTTIRDQRDELLTALKAWMALFDGPDNEAFLIAPVPPRLMTNGDQDRIDAAISLAKTAIQNAETHGGNKTT
jgi:hypothetical protein